MVRPVYLALSQSDTSRCRNQVTSGAETTTETTYSSPSIRSGLPRPNKPPVTKVRLRWAVGSAVAHPELSLRAIRQGWPSSDHPIRPDWRSRRRSRLPTVASYGCRNPNPNPNPARRAFVRPELTDAGGLSFDAPLLSGRL